MKNEHNKHELRSLEMHRLIGEKLKKNPSTVIQFALNNLTRWEASGVDCADFHEWKQILKKEKPNTIFQLLTNKDEKSTRLRQSSPFPGLLPEKTRRKIFQLP